MFAFFALHFPPAVRSLSKVLAKNEGRKMKLIAQHTKSGHCDEWDFLLYWRVFQRSLACLLPCSFNPAPESDLFDKDHES